MLPGRQTTHANLRSSLTAGPQTSAFHGRDFLRLNGGSLRFGFALLVACLGLGISGYLTYSGFTGTTVAGCDGGTFDCSHVLSSRWSKIGGLPVALPAMLLYTSLLVCLSLGGLGANRSRFQEQVLALLLFAAASAAVWFIGLQVFLGKYCLYCCIAHGCSLILSLTILPQLKIGFGSMARFAGVGIVAAGIMAVLQYQTEPPPTFRIETHDGAGSTAVSSGLRSDSGDVFAAPGVFEAPSTGDVPVFEAPVFEAPVFEAPVFEAPGSSSSESSSPAMEEAIEDDQASTIRRPAEALTALSVLSPWFGSLGVLQGGEVSVSTNKSEDSKSAASEKPKPRLVPVSSSVQLRVDRWPLYGDKDARYVFVAMFDYTCSHCRTTYQAIRDAKEKQGLDLAVVSLPTPLHKSCNDAAMNNDPQNAERCEVAKLAISVWLADPTQFPVFHDWLFLQPRSAGEAKRKAAELVGEKRLQQILASPTPAAYVAQHVVLYKQSRAGTLPKLFFPTTTVIGEVGSGTTIANLVRSNLQ